MRRKNHMHNICITWTAVLAASVLTVTPVMAAGSGTAKQAEASVTTEAGVDSAPQTVAEALTGQKNDLLDADIYQIRIGYEFSDGSFDEWARGTAFLVADRYLCTAATLADTSTTSALYTAMLKERSDIYSRVGIDLSNENTAEKHIKIYVTDENGEKKDVKSASVQHGLAVITLAKAESATPVVFEDSGESPAGALRIKFAGKNDDKCVVQKADAEVSADSTEKAGFVIDADTSSGNPTGAPVYDASGYVAGMAAADGDTMTCYTASAVETFLTSNGISFKTAADVAKEKKETAEKQTLAEVESAQSSVADDTALQQAVSDAEKIDKNSYTDSSIEALDAALANAEDVLNAQGHTQSQADAAVKQLVKVEKALEKVRPSASSNLMMLASGGFAVIVGLIVCLVMVKNHKKKMNQAKKAAGGPSDDPDSYSGILNDMEKKDLTDTEDAPDSDGPEQEDKSGETAEEERDEEPEEDDEDIEDTDLPMAGISRRPGIRAKEDARNTDTPLPGIGSRRDASGSSRPQAPSYPPYEEDDLDVTTVRAPKEMSLPRDSRVPGLVTADQTDYEDQVTDLKNGDDDGFGDFGDEDDPDDDGEEGTTVLHRAKGYLIRVGRPDEKICITHDNFLIGKERKKVDYCVTGDSSVSRVHCRIRIISGEYYIEDLKSTNYTFVNGSQIPEYKTVYLQDGSSVKLSDVEFVFHIE